MFVFITTPSEYPEAFICIHVFYCSEVKILKMSTNLPAPATTIFCLGKSIIGLPCALTAPKSPAIATPAVPCTKKWTQNYTKIEEYIYFHKSKSKMSN